MANGWLRLMFLVCLAGALAACDQPAPETRDSNTSEGSDAEFEAVITGSYDGDVSGPGVLVLLADAGLEKQGYYFLADGQGVRDHGVTFILPRGTAPGRHTLQSTSAFDIGSLPSVRVDRDTGSATLSADRNTSGLLELTAFPNDERNLRGASVSGEFRFETEDADGQKITVTGSFSFTID